MSQLLYDLTLATDNKFKFELTDELESDFVTFDCNGGVFNIRKDMLHSIVTSDDKTFYNSLIASLIETAETSDMLNSKIKETK